MKFYYSTKKVLSLERAAAHSRIQQVSDLNELVKIRASIADQKVTEVENQIGRALLDLTDARKTFNAVISTYFPFGNGTYARDRYF